ncbi:hypothetical protein M9H77_16112 [Catharanthus roseus]|uniref:Uncharacterized protein n=1 Tax=Catharanthus roseus TaxID=4058 RepID=A0ACC0B068_CATRO|nr:hypothetical protein M9H77_16112 [Catharanthus roseus]
MYVSLFGSVERYYELIQRIQWWDGHAPQEDWLDTLDSLYVIANAFNLYMVLIARLGSTTLLPLYSYSYYTARTLIILQMRDRCSLLPLHVQWQYHRSDRVSGWVKSYSDWIANWNTRYRREYPTEDPIHVNF